MERREFLKRLGKSLLLISAVAVAGRLLSERGGPDEAACSDENRCSNCAKSAHCGLPKFHMYNNLNTK
jgi:hypothetical protein